jgi:hypothetical protein
LRSQKFFVPSQQAGFDALALMRLIDRTFTAALIPHKDRGPFVDMFWKTARDVLTDYEFPHAMDYPYFPPLQ